MGSPEHVFTGKSHLNNSSICCTLLLSALRYHVHTHWIHIWMSFELLHSNALAHKTQKASTSALFWYHPHSWPSAGRLRVLPLFQWNLAFMGPVLLYSQISSQLLILVTGEAPHPQEYICSLSNSHYNTPRWWAGKDKFVEIGPRYCIIHCERLEKPSNWEKQNVGPAKKSGQKSLCAWVGSGVGEGRVWCHLWGPPWCLGLPSISTWIKGAAGEHLIRVLRWQQRAQLMYTALLLNSSSTLDGIQSI